MATVISFDGDGLGSGQRSPVAIRTRGQMTSAERSVPGYVNTEQVSPCLAMWAGQGGPRRAVNRSVRARLCEQGGPRQVVSGAVRAWLGEQGDQ